MVPLEADAGGEHKSSNVHGELELILVSCATTIELDFDPRRGGQVPGQASRTKCVWDWGAGDIWPSRTRPSCMAKEFRP